MSEMPSLGRVVVLGGGTGISPCLAGIKSLTSDITAIVTVADDGGSSGRLRKDYDMLPPGDIRNCLVALSEGDPRLASLFAHRFEDALLRGHAFGNLFLAVVAKQTGDFRAAIDLAATTLGVKGKVIPSTDRRVVLVASHPDGTKSTGENRISRSGKVISKIELRPNPPPISDEIRSAIAAAEVIVLGPGSLFTSIIPNLLVPGMAEAVAHAKAKIIYVANVATQPGETGAFDLASHVRAVRDLGGLKRIDYVVIHDGVVSDEIRARYTATGAEILSAESQVTHVEGIPLVRADVVSVESGLLRHHSGRLARVLREIAGRK